ncbi:hypothetical protein B0T18DRAFT_395250 [Schizothecium vesticola]|uniref:Uncharacterized protein n=1 Tax=Schizothecium vesticola TaxID=314040 RepID=A0AA40KBB0_9PEZI|nr:hypothetical protein B0T18DRAFT_395250 [Schizothecium vesticola]
MSYSADAREPTRPFRLGSPQHIFSRFRLFLCSQLVPGTQPHTCIAVPNGTHGNRQHDPASPLRPMIPLHASSVPPRLVPSAVGRPSSEPWPMADATVSCPPCTPRSAVLRLGSAHPNTCDDAR